MILDILLYRMLDQTLLFFAGLGTGLLFMYHREIQKEKQEILEKYYGSRRQA